MTESNRPETDALQSLDRLISQLDDLLSMANNAMIHNRPSSPATAAPTTPRQPEPTRPDAIDRVIRAERRAFDLESLRDVDEVLAFRRQLAAGRLQLDTVGRILDLIGTAVATFRRG